MINKDNLMFYLKITGTLVIIASLTALMLSVVNGLTADKIEANNRAEIEIAMSELFPEAVRFESAQIQPSPSVTEIRKVYNAAQQLEGYCVFVTAKGFRNAISLIVGVLPDGTAAGVKVMEHSETIGLGSNIEDEDYLLNFKGRSAGLVLNEDIDALTGATISSRALLNGVNTALEAPSLLMPDTTEDIATETDEGNPGDRPQDGLTDETQPYMFDYEQTDSASEQGEPPPDGERQSEELTAG